MATDTSLATPNGVGSVTHAPNLPADFTQVFESKFVETGQLRLHAVIGGEGPPLLLVHGWPQNWYAWRQLMPALAQKFTVIAVDQRGIGLSDKPLHGYDTGTLANDLIGLMETLGHHHFAVVGHDTGFAIGYALAADYPDRVTRIVLAEIPGPPMSSASPPVFVPAHVNNRLWHIPFCRVEALPEQLVVGREDLFFGYEFEIQGGKPPADAIAYYVDLLSRPDALSGSFGFYRALDMTLAQNEMRKATRLTLPVLAIGGERSYGEHVADTMKLLADDVRGVVIPGTGHWIAEDAPEATLAAIMAFLSPYGDVAPVQVPPVLRVLQ
ncbi:alpha/beta fold hydrolase [Sphingomonas sp. M1-B02]|uniref:alpha/beta fold hydrolase n=1 Tax=Sphingomonas sp. M1-B02 TaxID=3114300 RepID=UPI0022405382|nr:alpha/beta hydrolase [Sphingomonas sp. S6-11]UZK66697.1 alpha/beta hydrolase [Sphingomonas sp. S6-11]